MLQQQRPAASDQSRCFGHFNVAIVSFCTRTTAMYKTVQTIHFFVRLTPFSGLHRHAISHHFRRRAKLRLHSAFSISFVHLPGSHSQLIRSTAKHVPSGKNKSIRSLDVCIARSLPRHRSRACPVSVYEGTANTLHTERKARKEHWAGTNDTQPEPFTQSVILRRRLCTKSLNCKLRVL